MKRMLSLAAMFAVLSYASPASAELKFSGDAGVRGRAENNNSTYDDVKYQYRIRLKVAADLEDGYYFNAMAQNEDAAGAWTTVSGKTSTNSDTVSLGNTSNIEKYKFELSNFYFGRNQDGCQYKIGRIPLNSFNNPIFDLALYAVPTSGIYAVDIPVSTFNFDRFFGVNYGSKIGNGDLNVNLFVLDNSSTSVKNTNTGDGLLNDGYALHVSYKTTHNNVTVEPQVFLPVRNLQGAVYQSVLPYTFGTNVTIPVTSSKIGVSAFYTICKDNGYKVTTAAATKVDYTGYLLRLKGESGDAMAWIDYNHTTDKTVGNAANYNNTFIWAQYNFKINELKNGKSNVNITPTIRYRASGKDTATSITNNQLRGELYATVSF